MTIKYYRQRKMTSIVGTLYYDGILFKTQYRKAYYLDAQGWHPLGIVFKTQLENPLIYGLLPTKKVYHS